MTGSPKVEVRKKAEIRNPKELSANYANYRESLDPIAR